MSIYYPQLIENNYYFNYIHRINNMDNGVIYDLYINNFKFLNIKKNDMNFISFNNNLLNCNINNLNKVINRVGNNYICIFHEDHRFNGIYSFKYYNSEFNKNNYPLIFFNNIDKFIRGDNLLITEILGSYNPLYEYHDIVANAQEIHCVNSFVACYFNTLFDILPEKFKNVRKYMYHRSIYTNKLLKNNHIQNNHIRNMIGCDTQFYNFKLILPINYFNNNYDFNYIFKNNHDNNYYKPYIPKENVILYDFIDTNKYGNNMFTDNSFCILKNSYNTNYYNKFLININSLNVLGILDINAIKKKPNFIIIDLIENMIKEYGRLGRLKKIENINNINDYLIIFLEDPNEYINVIFIKNNKPFYIIVNERQIDNDFNIISDDNIIDDYDIDYCKIITTLNENQKISYIFPFTKDDQFFKWEWFYYNLICIAK